MHTQKALFVGVCSAVALLGLSVVGGRQEAVAQTTSDTLKKIKETGAIVLGHRDSSIPFSYLDDKQQPIGYSMDLCYKIVDAVKAELKMPNLQVKLNPVTSANRIPLMQNGTIDLECGSTTNSQERQKQVAFGVATFIANVKITTKKGSGVSSLSDLNGQPIATTSGTTSVQLIKQHEKGKGVDFKELYGKDHAESFLLLETDRAKAFVMDDILLAGLIANSKTPENYKLLDEVLRSEPYGVMLRKDDPGFKTLVDKTLIGLMKSGEIDKLYSKWFMSPIPPKNVNLNFPMSKELQEAIKNPTDKGV